jgi:hypothetical protein
MEKQSPGAKPVKGVSDQDRRDCGFDDERNLVKTGVGESMTCLAFLKVKVRYPEEGGAVRRLSIYGTDPRNH